MGGRRDGTDRKKLFEGLILNVHVVNRVEQGDIVLKAGLDLLNRLGNTLAALRRLEVLRNVDTNGAEVGHRSEYTWNNHHLSLSASRTRGGDLLARVALK